MDKYRLKLYINGRTHRSQAAIDNLERLLERDFPGQYELEIIDVRDDPGQAEEHKILATPTVIRDLPLPLRRVLGDLSERHEVLAGLDLEPVSSRDEGRDDND